MNHRRASNDPTSLGNILIEMGIISRTQLQSALRIQSETQEMFLGQILIDSGLLSEDELGTILKIQDKLRSGKKQSKAIANMNMAILALRVVNVHAQRIVEKSYKPITNGVSKLSKG